MRTLAASAQPRLAARVHAEAAVEPPCPIACHAAPPWCTTTVPQVPQLYKRLRYPFQISKSNLTAVGSPHTWPSLLVALTWLVELLNYQQRAEAARQVRRRPASGGMGRAGVRHACGATAG